jgi:hypothetical protein
LAGLGLTDFRREQCLRHIEQVFECTKKRSKIESHMLSTILKSHMDVMRVDEMVLEGYRGREEEKMSLLAAMDKV